MGSRGQCGDLPAGRAPGHMTVKWPSVHILPCTVSHILTSDLSEVNQVSIVGVVIRQEVLVNHILYQVDDMTAAPLTVKHWLDTESGVRKRLASPGTYVKVSGTVQTSQGKMRILATSVRCLDDHNELTSHMLEVVHAHRATSPVTSSMTSSSAGRLNKSSDDYDITLRYGLSPPHSQVLNVIHTWRPATPPGHVTEGHVTEGISFKELCVNLKKLQSGTIRDAVRFLLRDGHIFTTVDDRHYKSSHNT